MHRDNMNECLNDLILLLADLYARSASRCLIKLSAHRVGEPLYSARRAFNYSLVVLTDVNFKYTPFDQPKPSCNGYSPPPAPKLVSNTLYFSTIFPVFL